MDKRCAITEYSYKNAYTAFENNPNENCRHHVVYNQPSNELCETGPINMGFFYGTGKGKVVYRCEETGDLGFGDPSQGGPSI